MWCRAAGDSDCPTFAVHLTVMSGRSVQLLPNIYYPYALSGADCAHMSAQVSSEVACQNTTNEALRNCHL